MPHCDNCRLLLRGHRIARLIVMYMISGTFCAHKGIIFVPFFYLFLPSFFLLKKFMIAFFFDLFILENGSFKPI